MAWDFRPLISATKPIPQESCSSSFRYKPPGNPFPKAHWSDPSLFCPMTAPPFNDSYHYKMKLIIYSTRLYKFTKHRGYKKRRRRKEENGGGTGR
jgi:hypothetical protein